MSASQKELLPEVYAPLSAPDKLVILLNILEFKNTNPNIIRVGGTDSILIDALFILYKTIYPKIIIPGTRNILAELSKTARSAGKQSTNVLNGNILGAVGLIYSSNKENAIIKQHAEATVC